MRGWPCTVLVNYCPLSLPSDATIHQYDVSFNPRVVDADGRRRALRALEPQLTARFAEGTPTSAWAYDGDKILYTLSRVNDDDPFDLLLESPRLMCSIKPVQRHTLGELYAINAAQAQGAAVGRARPMLHVLDIILKHHGATFAKAVGQSIFDPDADSRSHTLLGREPCDAEMWLGYRQTVVQTESGPMLQLDLAMSSMLAPMNVVQFVAVRLRQRDPTRLALYQAEAKVVARQLKGRRVKTTHNHRVWRVHGLSSLPADESLFDDERHPGQRISVAKYFERRYGIALALPHLPCLKVGRAKAPIEVPMELCELVGGQPQHELSAEQRQTMVGLACMPPHERYSNLLGVVERAADNPTCDAFGVGLRGPRGRLREVSARVLEPLQMCYRDQAGRHAAVSVDGRTGAWQMRDRGGGELRVVVPSSSVEHWAVVSFASASLLHDDVDAFIRHLARVAKLRGMTLAAPSEMVRLADATHGVEARLEKLHAAYLAKRGAPLSLLLCVLPERGAASYLYPAIKRWSHCSSGVATQCVRADRLCRASERSMSSSALFLSSLLLKINLKLGGANAFPPPGGVPLLHDAPTIVFGADVYHAPPGAERPSFAAVVSAVDRLVSSFYTTVAAQPARHEVIDDLDALTRRHLRHFYHKNGGVAPRRIVFYRDGVGISQFPMIREREVEAIRRACVAVGGDAYRPPIVFIVVQKRNHCRMFLPVRGGGEGPLQLNAAPGTVIDSDIVTPGAFDFYLCSHQSLKGTSKPTHYSVITDDLNLGPDELQRLTFDLCHVYARCTRTVSNPAPCYYAHLAANHAHFYMHGFREDRPGAKVEEDAEGALRTAARDDVGDEHLTNQQAVGGDGATRDRETQGASPNNAGSSAPRRATTSGDAAHFLPPMESVVKTLYYA